MTPTSPPIAATVAMLFAAISWGSLFLVGKPVLGRLDPVWFTAVRYLLAGVGIALRSTWDVGPELKSGALTRVLPAYSVGKRVAVYAVYPSRRHMEQKVRAFVDYLAELYGATPYWDEGLAL